MKIRGFFYSSTLNWVAKNYEVLNQWAIFQKLCIDISDYFKTEKIQTELQAILSEEAQSGKALYYFLLLYTKDKEIYKYDWIHFIKAGLDISEVVVVEFLKSRREIVSESFSIFDEFLIFNRHGKSVPIKTIPEKVYDAISQALQYQEPIEFGRPKARGIKISGVSFNQNWIQEIEKIKNKST